MVDPTVGDPPTQSISQITSSITQSFQTVSMAVLLLFLLAITIEIHSYRQIASKCVYSGASLSRMTKSLMVTMSSEVADYTISDLRKLNTKAALLACCGDIDSIPVSVKFENVNVEKSKPTYNRFIIANPKALLNDANVARSFGINLDSISESTPLSEIVAHLPVIYIADVHSEYGTMGYMLNNRSSKSMGDSKPEYRMFRNRPIFKGGATNRGSSFTMLHRKGGFPENRALRVLPGPENIEYKLYFSPDIAMANELCMTKDATPEEFKFFEWASVWSPKQLEQEYDKKMWLTIKAPSDVIFDDNQAPFPLWSRIVASLPDDLLRPKK